MQNRAAIVVMAPRKDTIEKLCGDGGAKDTRRFLGEVKTAWQIQRCETDLLMAALQQALTESIAAIQSLTEEVARLTSMVVSGQNQAYPVCRAASTLLIELCTVTLTRSQRRDRFQHPGLYLLSHVEAKLVKCSERFYNGAFMLDN